MSLPGDRQRSALDSRPVTGDDRARSRRARASAGPDQGLLDELAAVSPGELFRDVQPPGARRFLLAAAVAFAERGFHATTTRDIARISQSSSAGMYTYFASKEDLLYEMAKVGHVAALEQIRESLKHGRTPPERIERYVRDSVVHHAREHKLIRVILADFRALDRERFAEITALRHESKLLVVQELQRGVDSGHFRVGHVDGAATALLRMVDVSSWYSERGPLSPLELADIYADLALNMLGVSARGATTVKTRKRSQRAG